MLKYKLNVSKINEMYANPRQYAQIQAKCEQIQRNAANPQSLICCPSSKCSNCSKSSDFEAKTREYMQIQATSQQTHGNTCDLKVKPRKCMQIQGNMLKYKPNVSKINEKHANPR